MNWFFYSTILVFIDYQGERLRKSEWAPHSKAKHVYLVSSSLAKTDKIIDLDLENLLHNIQ